MIKHKHMKLDQSKIDRAKELLGAKTERETIEHALDLVLAEASIVKVHRRVAAVGGAADLAGSLRGPTDLSTSDEHMLGYGR